MKTFAAFCLIFVCFQAFGADRAVLRISDIPSDMYSSSHALIISVSDYSDGWAVLSGVRQDSEAVSSALAAQGFNVRRSSNPSAFELKNIVNDFMGRYAKDPKARILIYFAGHGHTLNGIGYVVGRDAKDPVKDEEGFRRGALPIDFFAEKAKEISSKHALFVFDSCFSGTVFKSLRSIAGFRAEMLSKPAKSFIASGTESQQVPDDSVFRKRFTDGIAGYADDDGDGLVTGSELGRFIQTEVSEFSAGTQTPVYGKLAGSDGEFLFFAGGQQAGDTAYAHLAETGEKERLLAVIRRSPGSIEADNALKRLREIDDSLKNRPPVTSPKREDRVVTVTSRVIYKRTDMDYPFVVIAPVRVFAGGRSITAAFSVEAANGSAYKNLINRKEMLRSVIGHKIEDEKISPSDSMAEVRRKIKQGAKTAMDFACPSCGKGGIVLKGLMIK